MLKRIRFKGLHPDALSGKFKTIVLTGLLTAATIIIFEAGQTAVLYNYWKFDYLLSAIACSFLVAGFFIGRNKQVSANTSLINASSPSISVVLTTRERQILTLIAAGKTNKEIAADIYVEVSTVKTHINNLYSKLSVSNRKEALARFEEMSAHTAGI